jgi:hypothetical protein
MTIDEKIEAIPMSIDRIEQPLDPINYLFGRQEMLKSEPG